MSVKTDITIIYNEDGSIYLNDNPCFIQKGNSNINKVFVSVIDRDAEDYTLTANFTLPNGNLTTLSSSGTGSVTIDGTTYYGNYFYLTSAETVYAGYLQMSIKVVEGTTTLFTYNTTLTINESSAVADESTITVAQYNALVETLASYQLKYKKSNVRGYSTYANLTSDLENLEDGQVVVYYQDSKYRIATISSNALTNIQLLGGTKLYKHTIVFTDSGITGFTKFEIITPESTAPTTFAGISSLAARGISLASYWGVDYQCHISYYSALYFYIFVGQTTPTRFTISTSATFVDTITEL